MKVDMSKIAAAVVENVTSGDWHADEVENLYSKVTSLLSNETANATKVTLAQEINDVAPEAVDLSFQRSE